MDREFVFQVLMARETSGSTGIGGGIAIPHARSPMVLHVPHASMSLCFLRQPIDFAAIDRQPVHTIFSIISPTSRVHLHLLSRLAAALHDQEFLKIIAARGSGEEILREAARVEATFASVASDEG
jgi:PTS system nitrogen regulatory IIA component